MAVGAGWWDSPSSKHSTVFFLLTATALTVYPFYLFKEPALEFIDFFSSCCFFCSQLNLVPCLYCFLSHLLGFDICFARFPDAKDQISDLQVLLLSNKIFHATNLSVYVLNESPLLFG